MYKSVLLFVAVFVVSASALEGANRFLAATKTATSVVLSTTTVPSTVARTCYIELVAGLTQCRRRRALEEQAEIVLGNGEEVDLAALQPSGRVQVEVTAAPALDAVFPEVAPLKVGQDVVDDVQSSTEVEISGLGDCLGRSAFGLTIYYTTTTTVMLTSFSFTTVGSSTFTVNKCTPAGFPYAKC